MSNDFHWLIEEIRSNRKHKSAVILGWFNYIEYFAQIVQLGKSPGRYPDYLQSKVDYFPFLRPNGSRARGLEIAYDLELETLFSLTPDTKGHKLNCMLLGKKTDKFNIALYW